MSSSEATSSPSPYPFPIPKTPINDGSGKDCPTHSFHLLDDTASSRIESLRKILMEYFCCHENNEKNSDFNNNNSNSNSNSNSNLITAIAHGLGEATAHIAMLLSNYVEHTYAGSQNSSGDEQLHLDIDCDNAVFHSIRQCGVFAMAASEETPVETDVSTSTSITGSSSSGGPVFSLGFDPLDGSSIIDANFSVGSIYGIWPGKGIVNRSGREQVASAVALYGPRTTLLIALPSTATTTTTTTTDGSSSSSLSSSKVLEVTLVENRSKWEVSREDIHIASCGKIFAPGNLRASNDNLSYQQLIQYWIQQRYTLRYSGGMVPDIYHIFAKGKGIFSNVSSTKAKAKLRLVYEVAPMGLLVECAGGTTTHESYDCSVLDITIDHLDQRLGVCMGSSQEVSIYKQYLFPSSSSSEQQTQTQTQTQT